ncbi:hypoxanthine phosphoribosyltransferase [Spiroplasma endosymbiont of Anurida maritima]|uniref:hypoxanthine phosphoribosyltransferase n=1 Tax=Spiroplasma endosymbiont of Anurida maritima TaxID=2967972 RepID=UPI0036D3599F
MKKHPLVKKVIISKKQINKKIKELAKSIEKYYYDEHQDLNQNTVLCLGLLKGSVPFMAKFIEQLTKLECQTEYMSVASFEGNIEATGVPRITADSNVDFSDRDVLIVEDIIDSGRTLKLIKEYLFGKGAKSVKICTIFDKKEGRKVDLHADWYGFDVPHKFLIGFGLDYQERLRNLPYVAIADEDKIKNWQWKKLK